jgi:hypothetical protein
VSRGERLEFLTGARELTRLHALGQRTRLVAQFRLHAGKESGVFASRAFVAGCIFDLVPGGGDDLFLALGNLIVFLVAAAARTGGFLRLRVSPFEGLSLHEEHIGACGGVCIARRGVQAYQIARREFEIFQRNGSAARSSFQSFTLQQR